MLEHGISLEKYASIAEIKECLTDRTEIPIQHRLNAIDDFSYTIACPCCEKKTRFDELKDYEKKEGVKWRCPSCRKWTCYWENNGDIVQMPLNKKYNHRVDRFLREVRDIGSKINPGERVASLGEDYFIVLEKK